MANYQLSHTGAEVDEAIDKALALPSDGVLSASGTAADAAKLGGKAPQYYIQPRNLLDNSDFSNPVNQRGYEVYNTSGYTIDRWLLYFSDWANFTIENGLVFNIGSNGCSFYQRISTKSVKVGEKYTLAYMLDGVISVQEWICEATENESYDIAIGISQGTHTLYWVALYEGSYTADTLPPYMPKGYAVELAECQRYYWETDVIFRASQTETISVLNIQFPQQMRIIPTITNEAREGYAPEGYNASRDGISYYSAPENRFTLSSIKANADL